MTNKLNAKLLALVKNQLSEKVAFVPMPGGDPAMGGDPAAMGGAPMDPAAMGGAPMDPAMAGGMPPMDPAAMGGAPMDPAAMPPPPAPAPAPAPAPSGTDGTVTISVDGLLKFVKQVVALCTNGKFGNDPRPTDGGPVSDNQAVANAKLDAILQAVQASQGAPAVLQ